jgi:hypothetical protein
MSPSTDGEVDGVRSVDSSEHADDATLDQQDDPVGDVTAYDGPPDDVPGVAAAVAPAETLILGVIPPAADAIVRPTPRVVTINDRLMATERQPAFNKGFPSSMVGILADWRLLCLDEFVGVKSRTRVWGTPIAQAYAKREYMVALISDCATRVPENGPRPATRIEKEDLAAQALDVNRESRELTTVEYYTYLKARDPKVKTRKKKNQVAGGDG